MRVMASLWHRCYPDGVDTLSPLTAICMDQAMLPDSGRREAQFIFFTSWRETITRPLGIWCMLALGLALACPEPGRAEVRIVTGMGDHRMSDRATKVDAVRLATEEAKKQALEQVASYLESVTVVRPSEPVGAEAPLTEAPAAGRRLPFSS